MPTRLDHNLTGQEVLDLLPDGYAYRLLTKDDVQPGLAITSLVVPDDSTFIPIHIIGDVGQLEVEPLKVDKGTEFLRWKDSTGFNCFGPVDEVLKPKIEQTQEGMGWYLLLVPKDEFTCKQLQPT